MNGGPLSVQTEGLRQFSRTHSEIAAGVTQLLGGAPTAASLEATHGQIAFAVQNALKDVLGARQGTLQTTARSGDKISELLQKAASAYDKGDEQSAGKIKGTMEGAGAPGGGAQGGAGNPASAATGALGQMMGQVGQMGQQVGGSVQGLAQGLAQVPQQIMQGVQGIVQSATGAAGAGAEGGALGGAAGAAAGRS
ncbi:ESX-1 secretion-associated protein, partial [Mycobacterium sp. PS03-16]